MKKDKKEDKKEEIFSAICELITEGGFENVTISKIANKINKSKNLIFHYFESKQRMILEFVKFYITDIDISYIRNYDEIMMNDDGPSAIYNYINSLFEFHCNDIFDIKVYFSILGLSIIDEQISEYFKDLEEKTINDIATTLRIFKDRNVIDNENIDEIALDLFFSLNGIAVLQDTATINKQHFETIIELYKKRFISMLLKK